MYYMKVKYTYLSRDTQTISKLSNLVNREDLFGLYIGPIPYKEDLLNIRKT